MWGPHTMVDSAAACCAKCREHGKKETKGCNVWVYCGEASGCAGQKSGECWGKRRGDGELLPRVRGKGEGVLWTSGAIMSAAEAAAMNEAEAAAARAIVERRDRPGNARVYFDVKIVYSGSPAVGAGADGGRIEFILYHHEAPRAAENFRTMCTGEKGKPYQFAGMKFYRIIDMFIDQAGSHAAGGVWGGSFDDDPGGLKLRHERPGLLSAANSGPDTNSGHFSIVVAPAPHLDKGYTIFGEVVAGMEVVRAINKLDKYHKGTATVEATGCLVNCDPRPAIKPKCTKREEATRPVQGRPMHPCLD